MSNVYKLSVVFNTFLVVQGAAYAFGELLISERVDAILNSPDVDSSLKPMLKQIRRLFLLDAVLRDLGWFASNQLISPEGAKMVRRTFSRVSDIRLFSLTQ